MKKLIYFWFPNAISIVVLSLELPAIAFLILDSPAEQIISYTTAIACLMFANSLLYPICPFVVKNGNSKIAIKIIMLITFFVFVLYNFFISLYVNNIEAREVCYLFSFSLIIIGYKRYLQAIHIMNCSMAFISKASLYRVILTIFSFMFFIWSGFFYRNDIAAILAILLGGGLEVLILFRTSINRLDFHKVDIEICSSKLEFFRLYFSLIFLSASYLVSNFTILNLVDSEPFFYANWNIIFTIITISIYPFLDLDSVIIKFRKDNEAGLSVFAFLSSFICVLFFMIFIFIMGLFFKDGAVVDFLFEPLTILCCFLSPFLWSLRSILRVDFLLYKNRSEIIVSVIFSFLFCILLSYTFDILSPAILFNSIIFFDVVLLFFFKRLRYIIQKNIE